VLVRKTVISRARDRMGLVSAVCRRADKRLQMSPF